MKNVLQEIILQDVLGGAAGGSQGSFRALNSPGQTQRMLQMCEWGGGPGKEKEPSLGEEPPPAPARGGEMVGVARDGRGEM